MELKDAKRIEPGDHVIAPKIGIRDARRVLRVTPDPDPRVKMLVLLENGGTAGINYRLIEWAPPSESWLLNNPG